MCIINFIFEHLNDEHLNNLTTTFRKVTVNDILRGVTSYKDYDALERIVNYRYAYNELGLMTSRSESVLNRMEEYTYDKLDRLTGFSSGKIGHVNPPLQTFIYGNNGVVALHIETILPDTTGGGGGGDEGQTWLQSNAGIANGIYYIHTDHLGSYCALTDGNKKVKQRNYFDPWGNFKWIYATGGREDGVEFELEEEATIDTLGIQNMSAINFALTRRGFTGHEHYPQFKIINMNGRLYDPVIGRFFSPDKFVQLPEFTQNYNRYSYCLNNPLKYVDPSGNNFNDGFFAVITLPAKLTTEAFMWLNDKLNGYTRPSGYFNISYLTGRTEPGMCMNLSPSGRIPYGHPLYTPPFFFADFSSSRFGTGWAMGADNEWFNVTNRPILMKLTKYFLYRAAKKLGVDPGKPIPEDCRTSAFASLAKYLWFRYAPDPKCLIVGLFEGGSGRVDPWFDKGKFLGWSSMALHKEKAFTSLEDLFYTLGHELVHVSQCLALTGEDEKIYTDKKTGPNFRAAMDFYAEDYEGVLGGKPQYPHFNSSIINHDILDKLHHNNFLWTKMFVKPF